VFLSGEKGDADYNDREQKRGDQRGRVASCSFTLLARSCLRLNFLNKIFSNPIFSADQPLLLSCSPLSSQVMFYVFAFAVTTNTGFMFNLSTYWSILDS
jgi:hypothetical protein